MAASLELQDVTAGRDQAGWCLLFLEHLDEFARLAWYLVADAKLVEIAILRTMVRLDEISFDGSTPKLAYSQAREVLIQQSIALLELERDRVSQDIANGRSPEAVQAELIARLQQEAAFALRQPDVAERAATLGLDLLGTTPDQFAAFQRAEIVKWGKVIQTANIRVE